MKEVVILSAVRTAIGAFGGSLQEVSAVDLGKIVVKEALKRAGISHCHIDEVIFGCVLQGGLGQNVARQIAIHSGLHVETPAMTLNQVCGSGLQSVIRAAQSIMCGDADLIVAGGTENMSASSYSLPKGRWGSRMGNSELTDMMIADGLWDAFHDYHMGMTAENIANKYNISREDQDAFAFESQKKADQAIKKSSFEHEIVPVEIPQRKKAPILFSQDEHPRLSSLEKMAQLRTVFKKDGTVTAGNASGLNDGAAALIVASRAKANELGLTPLASIKGYASSGLDPQFMGLGPIPATKKALQKAQWTLNEIDLIEANEAFASQALAVVRELGLDLEKTNVNGGAIALGHPIGASGARILVTLIHALKERDVRKGLATLCVGGGMGVAMLVERPRG